MNENILSSNKNRLLFFAIIFLVSVSLRLGLTIYNREANDPHIQVIRYILREGTLPEKLECSECFQPKFFHYATAKTLGIMRLDRNRDADAQKIVVQFINFIGGITMLFILWIFIDRLTDIPAWIKFLGFALLAFNPQMIGINSQVTNDTFLILFCTIAVYAAHLVLRDEGFVHFLITVIFSLLAVITKTNGWVVVIAITISFFCKVLFTSISKSLFTKMLSFAFIYPLLVAGLAILSPLSQYVYNFQHYGSPFLLNIERQPRPLFFIKTNTPYAGILSIQDGFFTFKFIDLIKNPITDLLDKVDEDSHRTSLWTRLYGSANSIHFENYPPSWRAGNSTQASFIRYRGIFVLALLPTFVTLVGAATEIFKTVGSILTKNVSVLSNASYGLFAILFSGYIFFSAVYAFEYRVYNVMKAIFIYPGLLAFIVFFLKGTHLLSHYVKTKIMAMGFATWVLTLLFLYILDVASLIIHLLPNGSGINIIMESLMRNFQ